MNTLSTTRTITIGRCFLRKIMNNEGAIVSSTTAVHHYHHPHRSVDVGRGGDVVQRNSIMTMATGIHKRKLSSKVDVFHTINHNEKIKENDQETQQLLSPLNEKINTQNEKDGVVQKNSNNDDNDNDNNDDDDDDEMEKEEMFVQAHVSLGHDKIEWGGPRRGGRYSEPTRFGDWERKGRCTDF